MEMSDNCSLKVGVVPHFPLPHSMIRFTKIFANLKKKLTKIDVKLTY